MKSRKDLGIVDKMLENIFLDIKEGKIKKEDIKDIANILAEKKINAPSPEKFAKYEMQEKFMRDLYEGIPPKEENKRFFVNTFERYWKVLQDYRKQNRVPADYSLFPNYIAEAIKRGEISSKDVEIVVTPAGSEYRLKKPLKMLQDGFKIDIGKIEEADEKVQEKAKEERKEERKEKASLQKIQVGKNYEVFYVPEKDYIVTISKIDDKWMGEIEDLFPWGDEDDYYWRFKTLKLDTKEDVIKELSKELGHIDFVSKDLMREDYEKKISLAKKVKEEEMRKEKEFRLKQGKQNYLLPKGSDFRIELPKGEVKIELPKEEEKSDFGLSEGKSDFKIELPKGEDLGMELPKEEEKKEGKETPSLTDILVKDIEEFRKTQKAKVDVEPKMETEQEKKLVGKREQKRRAKEEKIVSDLIENWAGSREMRPLMKDFLKENIVSVAEKRPELAAEILKKEKVEELKDSESLRALQIIAEKDISTASQIVKNIYKPKIQEERNKIRNSISVDVKKIKGGLSIGGVLPEYSIVSIAKDRAEILPSSIYLETKKMEEENLKRKLKEQEEEQKLREEAQQKELENFFGQRPEKPATNFWDFSKAKPVIEKGVKSFIGSSPVEVSRRETYSGTETIEKVPYQVTVRSERSGGWERITTMRRNLLTGSVQAEEKAVPKSAAEILKKSVPARLIKNLVPMGTPQVRRWLHSQAGVVKPISRELDWRRVEMKRLRLSSRR